jgi:hypothetical protein
MPWYGISAPRAVWTVGFEVAREVRAQRIGMQCAERTEAEGTGNERSALAPACHDLRRGRSAVRSDR